MSALKSVLLAIDVATRQRDDAGKVLAQIQRSWRDARGQLEQLESYAADTESKWSVAARAQVTAEVVRHYYQFMERLNQAISLQHQAVAGLDKDLVLAKKALLAAELRIASLNQLLSKKRSGIERLQASREQKQLDEFAAMQHRRLRVGSDIFESP